MNCSKCKAVIPAGRVKCPRCGTMAAIEAPALLVLLKDRPWLVALLSASALLTLWLATRRASPPPPPPIQAVETPAAEPAPAPEPETVMPPPMPIAAPAPAPAAPEPAPAKKNEEEPPPPPQSSTPRELQADGTWK